MDGKWSPTGDELMPIGPHKGKPMRALDLEYLERIIGFDSEWRNYRPMFMGEIERRRQEAMRRFEAAPVSVELAREYDAVLNKVEPAQEPPVLRQSPPYRDIRTRVPIDLLILAKVEAARRDIPLNQFIIETLRKACEA
jgi:hypothetical protein